MKTDDFKGHTPGEWEWEYFSGGGFLEHDGETVLTAELFEWEKPGDLKLLAAAPELLKRVQELEGYVERMAKRKCACITPVSNNALLCDACRARELIK